MWGDTGETERVWGAGCLAGSLGVLTGSLAFGMMSGGAVPEVIPQGP